MEKCAQSGKDAPICNQGHEAGTTINLNVDNIIFDEKNDHSYSAQLQHHSSNENSMAKPTTVVVCSEGWGVVSVAGVVVVLFGGRGAGVTWVTILVLSKIVLIDIENWPEFLQIQIKHMN